MKYGFLLILLFHSINSFSLERVSEIKVTNEEVKALREASRGKDENKIIEAAAKILSKDPKHLFALNTIGVYYFNTGKLGLAKIIYERGLVDHPKEVALLNNMAVIYLAENNERAAIDFLKRAVKLDPNHEIASTNLSSIYLRYRDFKKAIGPLDDSFKATKSGLKSGDEQAVKVANNYAVALTSSGEPKKAQKVYEAILAGPSKKVEVLLNYAILQVEVLKDFKESEKIISKIKFITENKNILKKVAQLEESIKLLKK